jgi:hypothetical protein
MSFYSNTVSKCLYFQSILSEQQNDEVNYDLNTPEMHANLHSEFLQSVSTGRNPSTRSIKNNFVGHRNNKCPSISNVTKSHNLLRENRKHDKKELNLYQRPQEKLQQGCKKSVSGKPLPAVNTTPSTKKAANFRETTTFDSTKTKRSNFPASSNISNLLLSNTKRYNSSVRTNSKTSDKSNVVEVKSGRKTDYKTEPRSKQSNVIDGNKYKDKSIINSTNRRGNVIENSKHRKLGIVSPRPTVTSGTKQYKNLTPQDVRSEKPVNRMDTIKEEEPKKVLLNTSHVNNRSKCVKNRVPKDKDIQKGKTIVEEETLNGSQSTNSERKMELQLLDEIQKEFVAFLLPWLKLVPSTPAQHNSDMPRGHRITTEEKNKAWRNIVLKNLSKVCKDYIIRKFSKGFEVFLIQCEMIIGGVGLFIYFIFIYFEENKY